MSRARGYTVKHLDLDGAIIDRDDGYPDAQFELQPIGILTDDPVDRLQIRIRNTKTLLENEEALALRDWLIDNLRPQMAVVRVKAP